MKKVQPEDWLRETDLRELFWQVSPPIQWPLSKILRTETSLKTETSG
jgi:hypothetical protein